MAIEEAKKMCEKLHKLFSVATEAGEELVAIKNIPVEYLGFAIESLEKQIPKKMNDIDEYEEDELCGYCPQCNKLQSNLWNENFCGVCGQAIDWSVEE